MTDSQPLENFTEQMSLFLPQRTSSKTERESRRPINSRKLKTHSINFSVGLLPILFWSTYVCAPVCIEGDWVNVQLLEYLMVLRN